MLSEKGPVNIETLMQMKSGNTFTALNSISLLRDEKDINGFIILVIDTDKCHDISNAMQHEQKLARYKHIVDSTAGYIVYIDKGYIFRAVNQQYINRFNKKQEEILG